MELESVKSIMFGGIKELAQNRKYYYNSSVGSNYSYWTDEGALVLTEFMNIMVHKMCEAEEASLDRRAKDMVLSGLKGEQV